jgi:predicted dehydrogenase
MVDARFPVAVVGTGALGRHHVRILSELPEAELVGLYDSNPEAAARVAAEHGAEILPDLETVMAKASAVVLAVPTESHAEMGSRILERGLHVMVEKPIAGSLEEANQLIEAAAKADRILAVGHVEFFNPAVQALLASGVKPRFVETQRLGVFSPRSLDVDVILDLMIHDLQILSALDPSPVAEVRATGVPVLTPKVDIANVRVQMESGGVANLTASRVSADKVRKLRLFFPAGYYSVDYQSQEIKGYAIELRGEKKEIVRCDLPVEKGEPLRRELEAFVAACQGQNARIVDGGEARQALKTALTIAEAAKSATQGA